MLQKTGFIRQMLFVGTILLASNHITNASSTDARAEELSKIMRSVQFDRQPDSIQLKGVIKSKGPIEIRFRDPTHLRAIMEETPMIKADGVYFIRDASAEDGVRMSYLGNRVKRGWFIQVLAQVPLKLTGSVAPCPYDLVLPKKSDISDLSADGIGNVCLGPPQCYENGLALAGCIERFDPGLQRIRTADARKLLLTEAKRRFTSPDLYPHFTDLCPDALVAFTGECQVVESDYIKSVQQPLIYMARQMESLLQLRQEIPCERGTIFYLDQERADAGIYCEGPLALAKKFSILADDDIALTGEVTLLNHGLDIIAQGNMWFMGFQVTASNDIYTYAGKNCYSLLLYTKKARNNKPDDMDERIWTDLVEHWTENKIIRDDCSSDPDSDGN